MDSLWAPEFVASIGVSQDTEDTVRRDDIDTRSVMYSHALLVRKPTATAEPPKPGLSIRNSHGFANWSDSREFDQDTQGKAS